MNVHFSDDGWDDYLHWTRTDADIHRRLNALIEDVRAETASEEAR